jgi:hypothetical protein
MATQLENSIAEAMAYFGLGQLKGDEDTCFVAADVPAIRPLMLQCQVRRNGRITQCEFLRSLISVEWESIDEALIEVPKCFLPIFCLWDFVLSDKELERHRRKVEMFNAPYMGTVRYKQERPAIERVGGIRI